MGEVSATFEQVALGDLDDHHLHRGKYNFLYLCTNCARSFDSTEEREDCKYCKSKSLDELDRKDSLKLGKNSVYRYYCPSCDKRFKTQIIQNKCHNCGSKTVEFALWEDMEPRDKLMLKFFKIIKQGKKKIKQEDDIEKNEDEDFDETISIITNVRKTMLNLPIKDSNEELETNSTFRS